MPALNLPFTYDALVLPTLRHRILHEAILRGYTDVLVREVSLSDLTPAVEMPEDGGASLVTLYRYGDRLVRQARSLATGQPLTQAELVHSLSVRFRDTAEGPEQMDMTFAMKLFPRGRGRSDFTWACEDGNCPMAQYPLEQEGSRRDWPKPVVRKSSEQHARAWAQHNYAAAFVIADGVPFVECPEPVYELRAWPLPREMQIHTTPNLTMASRCFRLDEWHLAEAWAMECRCDVKKDAPRAVLLADDVLSRDTIYELAVSAITPLRRRKLTAPNLYEDCEGSRLLQRLNDGRLALEPWEVPLMLDTVEEMLELAVADGTYDDDRGDWRRLKSIVARWTWEKTRGRDLEPYLRFSDEDQLALLDIPDW